MSLRDIIEHVFQPLQRQALGEGAGEKVNSLHVPVRSIMSQPVITILPGNTLHYAVDMMQNNDISSLVIIQNGRLEGIVTKGDFLEAIAQMEQPEQQFNVHFSVKGVDIDDLQRSSMMEDFESLARRYGEQLAFGILFIYIKAQGANYRGTTLLHFRLQLRTGKGAFFSNSEGWNVMNVFRRALDQLDRQLLRSKELSDPKFMRQYLQRIGFPYP